MGPGCWDMVVGAHYRVADKKIVPLRGEVLGPDTLQTTGTCANRPHAPPKPSKTMNMCRKSEIQQIQQACIEKYE